MRVAVSRTSGGAPGSRDSVECLCKTARGQSRSSASHSATWGDRATLVRPSWRVPAQARRPQVGRPDCQRTQATARTTGGWPNDDRHDRNWAIAIVRHSADPARSGRSLGRQRDHAARGGGRIKAIARNRQPDDRDWANPKARGGRRERTDRDDRNGPGMRVYSVGFDPASRLESSWAQATAPTDDA
jgi:hypothetical protein